MLSSYSRETERLQPKNFLYCETQYSYLKAMVPSAPALCVVPRKVSDVVEKREKREEKLESGDAERQREIGQGDGAWAKHRKRRGERGREKERGSEIWAKWTEGSSGDVPERGIFLRVSVRMDLAANKERFCAR